MKNVFKGYEKLPGGDADQLEVLVRQDVIDAYPEYDPVVQHASLTHMLHEKLVLPDIKRVKLYDGFLAGNERRLKHWALGWHIPGSSTIHSAVGINGMHYNLPYRKASEDYDPTATMAKLIRNSVALSDVRHNRLACWYGRLAALVLEPEEGDLVSSGYRSERLEKERELFEEHKEDIRFKKRSGRSDLQ